MKRLKSPLLKDTVGFAEHFNLTLKSFQEKHYNSMSNPRCKILKTPHCRGMKMVSRFQYYINVLHNQAHQQINNNSLRLYPSRSSKLPVSGVRRSVGTLKIKQSLF
jgi:hypothetical protein